MRILVSLGLIASMLFVLGGETAPTLQSTRKKLIDYGWDEPSTAFMREHAAEMEKAPLDGCVFQVFLPQYKREDGNPLNFSWECWGKRAFTEEDMAVPLADLKAAPFKRFTENFLRVNTTPADLDWFDDYSAVLQNVRLAAKVAREGKCRGVLFDIEQYKKHLFLYHEQRDAKTKSFDEYAAQARKRGREVAEAFQEGYPDLTIFLTFGYCLPWWEMQDSKRPIADINDGLLAPFLDGLFAGAKGKTKIVDGFELSYRHKSPEEFESDYKMMREGALPIVADSDQYAKHLSCAFGLWLDVDWHDKGWKDEKDFAQNTFTPEVFGQAIHAALQRSDEYVWIYTERAWWWSPDSASIHVPDAYVTAVREAKSGH